MYLSEIGIPTQKVNQFAARGIHTGEDLVAYLPRAYKDYSHETGILPPDQPSALVVHVDSVQSYYNSSVPNIKAFCTGRNGERIDISWFNQTWRHSEISRCVNHYIYVGGKVTYNPQYKNYSIICPDVFEPDIKAGKAMFPIYKKIAGMADEYLKKSIKTALGLPEATAETCPRDILEKYGQISRKEALYKLHFPRDSTDVQVGQKRIRFDDLLFFALCIEWASRQEPSGSDVRIKTLKSYKAIEANLPYELTADQKDAIDEILARAREGKRVNALLQGDVGCGKSIVAFILMATMADSGYQSVIMAPTQVLARQHYEDLVALVEPLGFRVGYFGGSEMKKSEKNKLIAAVAAGDVDLIVGTHSVLGSSIQYKNLGLVITDEEHRFGVAQREALVKKARDGVHSVTMSATPIPRSLAQVIYGDAVQLLTIKTRPKNRLPVKTGMANGREKIYKYIKNAARKGQQTYVVCPVIDKSDALEGVKSVDEVAAEYRAELEPAGIRIETLTGRTKKAEMDDIISRFRAGQVDVLISTTVIEVGVNVPTATCIVISNAERFGLASLHQLRGRVGRGSLQSYCVLESETQTEEGKKRLKAMCDTEDGFQIAKADLELRGAGDFLGTQQSGDNKYMALMLAYEKEYEQAKIIAKELLDRGEDCCPLVVAALARSKD